MDGLGNVVHERLMAAELHGDGSQRLREPTALGDFSPAAAPAEMPGVATVPEATSWLHENALRPFLEEARRERLVEVDRIAEHVELSLTELLQKADEEIGRAERLVTAATGGAERFEGEMIERMHVEAAQRLLARASRA